MRLRKMLIGFWSEWRGFLLFILLMLVFRSSFATMYYIPSASMKPTIVEGDRVIVNELAYGFKLPFTMHSVADWAGPARGDIVVLLSPQGGTRLIKRVIGIPGDTIASLHDRLYINGTAVSYFPPSDGEGDDMPVSERSEALFYRELLGQRLHAVMFLPDRPALRSFAPLRIPADEYFVMGDNRDNSKDSRFIGLIPRTAIIGRAIAIPFSLDPAHYYSPRTGRLFTSLD
jgi:signal peptidase I